MRSSILTSKRAKALRRTLSPPELLLWSRLKRRPSEGHVFRCQHPLGPYILDFYCPAARLAVEVDGSIHGEEGQIAHDQRRDRWLEQQGVTVLRIPASSVFQDCTEVADGARSLAAEIVASRGAYALRDHAPSTTRSTPGLRPGSAGGPPPPSSSRRGRQG
ncbi:MAG: endonuclease domain-containing protein [Phenylobacterium sp.]|nr:endonuclease domain-containing protein [Phenylobacterium sp.]